VIGTTLFAITTDSEEPDLTAIEALAEAWASIDGELEKFRAERSAADYGSGTYVGYLEEAKELIKRIERRGYTVAPLSE
jgi:hypothetical protein